MSAQQNITSSHADIQFKKITLDDGLSQSSINAVVQDQRGLIWIATQDGLNVYDGKKIYTYFHAAQDTLSISHNYITQIICAHDSNLYFTTEKGVNAFLVAQKTFYHLPLQQFSSYKFSALAEDFPYLWLATENLLLRYHLKNKKFSIFSCPVANDNIHALWVDKYKNVWIGMEEKGLYVLKKNHTIPESLLTHSKVFSIKEYDQHIYVCTSHGIKIFDTKTLRPYSPPQWMYYFNNLPVSALLKDKQGTYWIATEGFGLYRYTKEKIQSYIYNPYSEKSISSNNLSCLFQDKDEIIWVGSDNGLNYFDPYKQFFRLLSYHPNNPNALSNNVVWSILPFNDTLIVGTDAGLDIFKENVKIYSVKLQAINGRKSVFSLYKHHYLLYAGTDQGIFQIDLRNFSVTRPPGNLKKINSRVYCFHADSQGMLWIGTKNGLYVYDTRNGTIQWFSPSTPPPHTLDASTIRCIEATDNHTFLLGTDNEGIILASVKNRPALDIQFEQKWQTGNNASALSNNTILSLLYDKNKNLLLAGTFGGGLNLIKPGNDSVQYLTTAEGLSNNVIYNIIKDNKGNYWISTNNGISKLSPDFTTIDHYFASDGLQSNEFNIGAAAFDPRTQTIYFGGVKGLNYFNPSQIQKNPHPPHTEITNIYLFNIPIPFYHKVIKKTSPILEMELPSKYNVFSIELSALHFSAPQKNQIKYQLEPFDMTWVTADPSGIITYTNLDPGEYLLKVKAANSDNVWSQPNIIAKITILPPYWKTWWFRLLMASILLALIYAVYYIRVSAIERQKEYLEELVNERTYEIIQQKEKIEEQNRLLEEEKKKVEKLLLNILPQETVDELKNKGKAAPRSYRMASIMFTDFKGFTIIAEKMRPKDLVAQLDAFFIKFDEIIGKYNIEKIKTMGDAYMAGGGIPIRNKTNPIDITLAALEIREYVNAVNETKIKNGEIPWPIRIGINTGELIAGVVGIKRFAYDTWGDTVNVAARMQMASEEGKINVSGNTYEYIKDYFVCEYRGKIPAKNKGLIEMYYVHRIKPELSADEKGTLPNEKFHKRVELNIYSKINYNKAEKHILKILQEKLPSNLYYHSIHHIYDVMQAAERIAIMEDVIDEDLFLLKTAALFHDAGFIYQYENNEDFGAKLAEEILVQYGYNDTQIEKVKQLIIATKVHLEPRNKLEAIIKDADLDYLGRDEFHEIANNLKKELMERGKIKSDKEWDELQIKFLTAHRYYTESAIKLRQEKKNKHLEEIKKRLENYT